MRLTKAFDPVEPNEATALTSRSFSTLRVTSSIRSRPFARLGVDALDQNDDLGRAIPRRLEPRVGDRASRCRDRRRRRGRACRRRRPRGSRRSRSRSRRRSRPRGGGSARGRRGARASGGPLAGAGPNLGELTLAPLGDELLERDPEPQRALARLARLRPAAVLDRAQPLDDSRWWSRFASRLASTAPGPPPSAKKTLSMLSSRVSWISGGCSSQRSSASRPAGVRRWTVRLRSPCACSSPSIRPAVGELAELGIDLAVARGPEEPRRVVDERLDLVAAHRPEPEHPEDHASGRREGLHIAARYIGAIHLCVISITVAGSRRLQQAERLLHRDHAAGRLEQPRVAQRAVVRRPRGARRGPCPGARATATSTMSAPAPIAATAAASDRVARADGPRVEVVGDRDAR